MEMKTPIPHRRWNLTQQMPVATHTVGFLLAEICFDTVWTSKYIHNKLRDEITYPFPNFNGCTVEVWEWVSKFIPYFTGTLIAYICWDWS